MARFDSERIAEARQIRRRLNDLQKCALLHRQPIGPIEAVVTGPGKGPERPPEKGWKRFPLHGRWGGYDQTTWFRVKATLPDAFRGETVVALLRLGGEGLAYVNGTPTQGLDPNRDRILLTNKAKGGESFEIVIEGVPSVRFDLHHCFEYADLAVFDRPAWDLYWDTRVAYEVYEQLGNDDVRGRKLLDLVLDTLLKVDHQHQADRDRFHASLAQAQRFIRKGLKDFPAEPHNGRMVMTGHSHIDTAWLWPLRETHRKVSRTWSTVLNYMDQYPEYRFSASQAVQYAWVKAEFPELYKRIQQRVKEGRWELSGAMWVEPDLNMPTGEALIRQILYGRRFFRSEFGIDPKLVWTPDTFGYCWALPQIMKRAGITKFFSSKLRWGNQHTDFPYHTFWWEANDGSRVMATMPTDNYNGTPSPEMIKRLWTSYKQKDKVDLAIFPYGFGDGGGGPTPEMLEYGKRMGDVSGMPRCEFGFNEDALDETLRQAEKNDLPVWVGELFYEHHRKCQTSQARTKRNNRKGEFMLRNAEWLSACHHLLGGRYDHAGLWKAWEPVLTNQFHDILPGSSITSVYEDADRDYAAAFEAGRGVRDKAVAGLVTSIDTTGEGTPIVVFNDLGWERIDVVEVGIDLPRGNFHVVDADGDIVPSQKLGSKRLLFEAVVPPMGYAVFWLRSGKAEAEPSGTLKASASGMENSELRLRFNKKGEITRFLDKEFERDILPRGARANALQLFDDRPGMWEAWDMDHNFEAVQWEPKPAESIQVVEEGPVRAVVRIVRKTEHSTITQDVTLYACKPRVDFVTHVDWHEQCVLMKAAFPVEVRAASATYEVQYGAVERPTHRNREGDLAMFEVPAHKWADLSEGDYGVSLLNDCKYGYDTHDNVMRITLLASPTEPDPVADQGEHRFTYSLFPHPGDWRNATVQQGFELNSPLHAVVAAPATGDQPARASFFAVDAEHVLIDCVKKAEDDDGLVVRVYEAYGQRGDVTLALPGEPTKAEEVDLMEENPEPATCTGNALQCYIRPFEVRTFKLTF